MCLPCIMCPRFSRTLSHSKADIIAWLGIGHWIAIERLQLHWNLWSVIIDCVYPVHALHHWSLRQGSGVETSELFPSGQKIYRNISHTLPDLAIM